MRFIFNFIFFGLLFFIIHKFLPDTFETLVSWVDKLYEVLADAVRLIYEKVQSIASSSGNAS